MGYRPFPFWAVPARLCYELKLVIALALRRSRMNPGGSGHELPSKAESLLAFNREERTTSSNSRISGYLGFWDYQCINSHVSIRKFQVLPLFIRALTLEKKITRVVIFSSYIKWIFRFFFLCSCSKFVSFYMLPRRPSGFFSRASVALLNTLSDSIVLIITTFSTPSICLSYIC